MSSPAKFAFVLYRPQSAGNIGAAARALKNMGFDDLRLVGRGPLNDRDAVKMAVHADDLLANATVYPSLAAALADCSLAVGTTSRRGGYRSRATPLRAAAVELDALATANKIAIVFGREDRGLTNRELKLCHRLVTIPTAPEYPSLNLAQAVMVVAYELMMAATAPITKVNQAMRRSVAAPAALTAEGSAGWGSRSVFSLTGRSVTNWEL